MDYYVSNHAFLTKIALFVAVALLTIYPTMVFLSWRSAVKQGQPPVVDARKLRLVRSLIHWELAGVVLIILFAALMARGFGLRA